MHSERAASEAGPARPILEIGQYCLFQQVYPDRSRWLFTGQPDGLGGDLRLARPEPLRLETLARDVAAGRHGLVVCFAPPVDRRRWKTRLADLWRPAAPHPARLAQALAALETDVPLVVLDMEDHPEVLPYNLPLLDRARVYFKREHAPAVLRAALGRRPDRLAKVKPIAIGLSARRLAAVPPLPVEKTVDLFFAGTIHAGCAERERGLAQLRALEAEGARVEIARDLPLEEYLRRCARAWLVWSPCGLGAECFRHYEALACGSVPLVGRSEVIVHRPLEDGRHCLYYDPEGDGLARTARAALAGRERLARLAEEGRRFVLEHHTHAALCRYVVESIPGPLSPAVLRLAGR